MPYVFAEIIPAHAQNIPVLEYYSVHVRGTAPPRTFAKFALLQLKRL
jgi:hypothetical protein